MVEINYDEVTRVTIDNENRLIKIDRMDGYVDLEFISNLGERIKAHEELNFVDVVKYNIILK